MKTSLTVTLDGSHDLGMFVAENEHGAGIVRHVTPGGQADAKGVRAGACIVSGDGNRKSYHAYSAECLRAVCVKADFRVSFYQEVDDSVAAALPPVAAENYDNWGDDDDDDDEEYGDYADSQEYQYESQCDDDEKRPKALSIPLCYTIQSLQETYGVPKPTVPAPEPDYASDGDASAASSAQVQSPDAYGAADGASGLDDVHMSDAPFKEPAPAPIKEAPALDTKAIVSMEVEVAKASARSEALALFEETPTREEPGEAPALDDESAVGAVVEMSIDNSAPPAVFRAWDTVTVSSGYNRPGGSGTILRANGNGTFDVIENGSILFDVPTADLTAGSSAFSPLASRSATAQRVRASNAPVETLVAAAPVREEPGEVSVSCNLDAHYSSGLKMEKGFPVLVKAANPDKEAARAGIRAGDIIESIDGILVENRAHFKNEYTRLREERRPGRNKRARTIRVVVRRKVPVPVEASEPVSVEADAPVEENFVAEVSVPCAASDAVASLPYDMTRLSADVAELSATVNLDPESPEFLDIFREWVARGGASNVDPTDAPAIAAMMKEQSRVVKVLPALGSLAAKAPAEALARRPYGSLVLPALGSLAAKAPAEALARRPYGSLVPDAQPAAPKPKRVSIFYHPSLPREPGSGFSLSGGVIGATLLHVDAEAEDDEPPPKTRKITSARADGRGGRLKSQATLDAQAALLAAHGYAKDADFQVAAPKIREDLRAGTKKTPAILLNGAYWNISFSCGKWCMQRAKKRVADYTKAQRRGPQLLDGASSILYTRPTRAAPEVEAAQIALLEENGYDAAADFQEVAPEIQEKLRADAPTTTMRGDREVTPEIFLNGAHWMIAKTGSGKFIMKRGQTRAEDMPPDEHARHLEERRERDKRHRDNWEDQTGVRSNPNALSRPSLKARSAVTSPFAQLTKATALEDRKKALDHVLQAHGVDATLETQGTSPHWRGRDEPSLAKALLMKDAAREVATLDIEGSRDLAYEAAAVKINMDSGVTDEVLSLSNRDHKKVQREGYKNRVRPALHETQGPALKSAMGGLSELCVGGMPLGSWSGYDFKFMEEHLPECERIKPVNFLNVVRCIFGLTATGGYPQGHPLVERESAASFSLSLDYIRDILYSDLDFLAHQASPDCQVTCYFLKDLKAALTRRREGTNNLEDYVAPEAFAGKPGHGKRKR